MSDIKKLRETFRVLAHVSIDKNFENGEYDDMVRAFRDGDQLVFNISIQAVANDLIWAHLLDGDRVEPSTYQRILKLKKKRGE